jgi:hypothetical protein
MVRYTVQISVRKEGNELHEMEENVSPVPFGERVSGLRRMNISEPAGNRISVVQSLLSHPYAL